MDHRKGVRRLARWSALLLAGLFIAAACQSSGGNVPATVEEVLRQRFPTPTVTPEPAPTQNVLATVQAELAKVPTATPQPTPTPIRLPPTPTPLPLFLQPTPTALPTRAPTPAPPTPSGPITSTTSAIQLGSLLLTIDPG